ncbi:helix-turn-helix domain-containing protein [Aurantimonas endophytica]|uniref:Chromosomal replication initiation ATPase DnaA n=1 Tax=Aurantimonas endophytica TaxID=1522175 RepID=A0A7W6HFU5_9HYPH|nr:helix-turn-helix domain-containing protein [Aurantimonas endophytica]MBB4004461.1 chromosomal replication initiation ATPase DnaA [Aurantimonas endophytica]
MAMIDDRRIRACCRHIIRLRHERMIDRAIARAAAHAAQDTAFRPSTYRPTLRRTLLRIAAVFKLHPNDIVGGGRHRQVAFARHAFMYWARRLTGKSLPQIGRFCGDRDHTTVLHSVRIYPSKRREMGRYVRSIA